LHGLNPTTKRKHCMITNTNTATLTTCDLCRENTTRKRDHWCSTCRGLFNIVKYIVCIIESIHTRNSILTWCKSALSNEKKACCFLQVLTQWQLIASDKRSI